MLEGIASSILTKYLGDYIEGKYIIIRTLRQYKSKFTPFFKDWTKII